MKNFLSKIAILILLVSCSNIQAQTNTDELWEKANQSYTTGDYKAAIAQYDSIYKTGYSGAKLFYNLGNAYFKDNQIGKSILFYNRAQHLAPSDEDIDFNLKVANGYVIDRIETVPTFFMKRWVIDLRKSLSTNSWAIVSVVFLALGLCAICFYLLSSRMSVRKSGFYGGFLFVAMFIVSVIFASVEKEAITNPVEAIVMSQSTPIKSSPDNNSKDIFVLHEGTKVRIISTLGEWSEILIADGNKGWISTVTLEKI